ncbi:MULTISPECIES: efflux transporter outer membrane subunit [unclassified Sphingomonas]|uniref:efflux transporter outer membrane subunit n=1 Tax=unclassified Sphingomonas TaxID=196159 RepID=UPI0006F5A3F0|nr:MULTISPECIES: efflux transporter outer membrane subunit [unclassified Sphingomonas]KQM59833.1 multidrug transporter [Sphingomonas sp. Leaf16]KQN11231.1 multidrug transporter [Sphingomonas sp. Leaf29]KQN18552.1 multidrug transporter [Sphingomonas sp. Leaf32]
MLSLIASLLLGGCAAVPEMAPAPRVIPAPSIARMLGSPSGQQEWPGEGWWTDFADPQLTALITEGLEGASDLRVAEARYARAEALVRQTRNVLLPSLNGSAEGGATKQSYNYLVPEAFAPKGWPDYGQGSLRLDWELDFWGRNRAALAAARSEAQAARMEAAAARLAVSAGVAGAYVDLAGLYAERDAAEHAIEVRTRTLALMRERRTQGLEHDGAIERAQSALATAQGERASLDEALTLSRNRIAVLIGAGPDRGMEITRPSLTIPTNAGVPSNLPAELIGRRPDVLAARLRSEAAASRIKQAKASFYPNVNLAGVIGLQALGIGNVFKSGSEFGTVGPAISLPIFDGGRLRGQYRAAEADYHAAVAQYDGALAQALREVADAIGSDRALQQRLDRAEEADRAATVAWRVATNRYRGGLATYLDVLTAEDALIATRRSVTSMKTRSFALDVALIRALGGGFRS